MVEYPWAESDTFPITESLICCCQVDCQLTMPFFADPFATAAEAEAYLDNQTDGCIAGLGHDQDYGSLTASFLANVYSLNASAPSVTGNANTLSIFVPVQLKAGSLLTINYTATAAGGTQENENSSLDISFYKSDGTPVGDGIFTTLDPSPSSMSGTATVPKSTPPPGPPPEPPPSPENFPIPEDGCYIIVISFSSAYGTTTTSLTLEVTMSCDDTMTPGGIRAAFDDGGSTSYLICA